MRKFLPKGALVLLAAGMLAGCGHSEHADHDHGAEHADAGHGGEAHEEESPSGASFKEGKGVTLTDETRKILGLEVVAVVEEKLPRQTRVSVHVFDEIHDHTLSAEEHRGCDVHGSGFLPKTLAASVRPGQPVQVENMAHDHFSGIVLAVKEAALLGEVEVIVGITNSESHIKSGDFLSAVIVEPRSEIVLTIPASALLRTSEGTFVYAVNGDAFFRTAVKVGGEADGKTEVIDGLYTGDEVVTTLAETLWLIELRATKGGGHCH